MDAIDRDAPPRKRPRKSRGRGLRTTTGCLTCRQRHKKCDETQPTCGPCKVSSRDCVFPHDLVNQPGLKPLYRAETTGSSSAGGDPQHEEDHQPSPVAQPPLINEIGTVVRAQLQPSPGGATPQEALQIGCSPDTVASELWTADFASTRWLDLLANDAAQADSGFSLSLAPSPVPEVSGHGPKPSEAASAHVSPALLNGQARLPESSDPDLERKAWQADGDVTLKDHEASLLRYFAERCAAWLDLFDYHRHFSTYTVRLALRNIGLMKAILALSAKYRSKSQDLTTEPVGESGESNEWIRYYYETLHYVQEALAYNSYTHSEELLATAIVVSAYEMLDESDGSGNWQRHLKGVFWIQRSQDVNGGSGGLRQAVWWAWLRQDVWAAFREKRRCLSFWVPVTDIHELDHHGLADRAIYLLSQAVNYSADSGRLDATSTLDPAASTKRRGAKEKLLSQMERFKTCLGDEYKPLPAPRSPSDAFTSLWIHPPQFGVALQAYSFAQILITLHSPSLVGLNGYVKMQRTLSEAVDTICGIARELKDEGCQIMSAQCLYGAGLCVQDRVKRHSIISMMCDCQARVAWAPMKTWRDDLLKEWAKADNEIPEEPC